MSLSRADQLRQSKNPLFNDRKLKLGTFSSNLSGGCAISKIDGTLKADWPSTMALARMGDEMEMEALVPVGRWKGFGGPTNFNGAGFESFTWAAAVGASTKTPGIFATSHVPTMHPVMAAKQGATVDHVTGGRFSLNIVTGWYQPEIEMFGEPMMEHDLRYERATEWLEVIKLLWTRQEEFDFEERKILQRQERLAGAEAIATALSGGDERRRLAARTDICDATQRCRFHRREITRSGRDSRTGRSL